MKCTPCPHWDSVPHTSSSDIMIKWSVRIMIATLSHTKPSSSYTEMGVQAVQIITFTPPSIELLAQ